MENISGFLENQALLVIFGTVVLLFSSGFLGIWLVPRHFSETQMKKILYSAAYTCGVIGTIPIVIVLFFFFEDWYVWGLAENDQRLLLILVVICSIAFIAVAFFIQVERALNKKRFYKELGLGHKILAGLALFIGVLGLPLMKITEKKRLQEYDFYHEEEEEEFEELETG
jgi:hypothetical protein